MKKQMIIKTSDLKYPETIHVIEFIENLNGTKRKEEKVEIV